MKCLETPTQLTTIELALLLAPPSERKVIGEFLAPQCSSLIYWNPGLETLQVWRAGNWQAGESVTLSSLISRLLALSDSVFLLENVATEFKSPQQLVNLFYQVQGSASCWLFIEEALPLVPPWLPVFKWALPNASVIEGELQRHSLDKDLARAGLGLYLGELRAVLRQLHPDSSLKTELMQYKQSKLGAWGVEVMAEPEIETTGGLERIEATLDRIAALMDDRARAYNLRLPKGVLLWGLPGTGKSLSAKLAARKMGVPLVAVDWGALVSEDVQGERRFRYLLSLASTIAPCVLFLDDFEKAFAGFGEGGVGRRLAGKLLTWMQEHQEDILVMATVNRLEMLPSELIRRFEYIFFVDLPHDGARYDVFNLHLSRYFSDYRFTQEEWLMLLQDYRDCTPAEIEQAIREAAIEAYYRETPGAVTCQDLLRVRQAFVPSAERDAEQLAAIRQRRDLARSASGEDCSQWRMEDDDIFG